MHLYHLSGGSIVEKENEFFKLVGVPTWDELVNRDDLHTFLKMRIYMGQGLMLKKFSQSAWLRLGRRKSGHPVSLTSRVVWPEWKNPKMPEGETFTAGSTAPNARRFSSRPRPVVWLDREKAFGYGGIRHGMYPNPNSLCFLQEHRGREPPLSSASQDL